MLKLLNNLLFPARFIPQGHCYLWHPDLVWLHVVSDALIALAYYSIPLVLVYFVQKRRDLPFQGIFLLFAASIACCGTTHIIELWTLWHPASWLSGFIKGITAAVSLYTALAVGQVMPKALSLPSSGQLEAANQALFNEVQERQRAESALRRSEQQFRAVFEGALDAMSIADDEGKYVQVNPAACELFGLPPEKLLGCCVTDFASPGFDFAPVWRSFQERGRERGEFCLWRPDGTARDVEYAAIANFLPHRHLSVMRDVTKRHQVEEELRQYRQHLEILVEVRTLELARANAQLQQEIRDRQRAEEQIQFQASVLAQVNDAVVTLDPLHRITYWNQGAERLYHYPSDEVLGRPLSEVYQHRWIKPEDRQSAYNALAQTGLWHGEIINIKNNGQVIYVELSSSVLKDESGNCVGFLGVIRNISDRKAIEKMKDEFISTVSHELRTPLTSIRGSLGLLAGGLLTAKPEKAQRMLEIAVTNTDRLVRLINDILDLERMTSGRIPLVKQTCNAADLMLLSCDAMRAMAENVGVTLSLKPVDLQVWADPDRIIQTLTNLLSNAIKFSPPGTTIWLSGEVNPEFCRGGETPPVQSPESLTQNSLLIAVKDQGRGIPADKLETIFERFQQVDASDSREKGGTGLGLAICRSIVQQHGGRIWGESTLGQGSTFYLTLPVSAIADR